MPAPLYRPLSLKTFFKYSLSATIVAASLSMTACLDDDDDNNDNNDVVVTNPDDNNPTTNYQSVNFNKVGSHVHGDFKESAAEIIAYHPASKRSFVVNAQNGKVDVVDISDVTNPTFIQSLDATDLGDAVNSVAVHDDIVVLAVQADVKTDNGHVALYNANTLERMTSIEVGALPDMVTFTHDGNYIVVANEGEPNDDYTVDAEGSISIINIMDINQPIVTMASFDDFESQKQALIDSGVRIFGKKADGTMSTLSEDLEPEYIAISSDDKTAYVSLQENNAIAVVDIASSTVTAIKPLGAKDHSIVGNELDVSDKDDKINITTWPIMGMYMPDAIAIYNADGKDYLVTANEGDAREWGDFEEEINIGDVQVDSTVFSQAACHDMDCTDENALGRIGFSASMGDSDNDGVYEKLYSFGARSFSIWDVSDMSQPVYDSGSTMAKYTAEKYPDNFNASNSKNSFENRSDNKGVEPEGVTIGQVGSQTIAFIGLERISSVMAFDVTDPEDVSLLGEINTRTFNDDIFDTVKEGTAPANADGDLGPEGLTFVPADKSPNGKPLLMVGFEVSGSSTIFELDFAE